MHSVSSKNNFLAHQASYQEFTNNNQETCAPSYFDSKLQALKDTNRKFETNATLGKSIFNRIITKILSFFRYIKDFFVCSSSKNNQSREDVSLISYYSRGKNWNINGAVREDGKIVPVFCRKTESNRSFVCRHMANAWLIGDLKLSQINSKKDLRQSPMVIKNGDTPEGIKKSRYDIDKRVEWKCPVEPEIFVGCVLKDDKLDHYFKQRLSKSEYVKLSSLRNKFFATAKHDTDLELLSYISSLSILSYQYKVLEKMFNIFRYSKTASINDIIHAFYKFKPAIGKLASNSNNDDVYSFSKNSFPHLLRELCETIYNRPEDSSECFRWSTTNHAMGLKIAKKDNSIKISFYNPDNTISHNFVLKSSKDTDKITIPILLSSFYQDLYKITNHNITDYDDMHVNTLIHVDNN
jgi:hypothetical protein